MQDNSSYNNSDPPQISDILREFIIDLVEDIAINGEAFDDTKTKWLKKFTENEGIDYKEYENNLSDFFELLSDYKDTKSAAFRRMFSRQAELCYITDDLLERLLESGEKEELAEPIILNFSVEPSECEAGGEIILMWNVENITDLYLRELPDLKLNEVQSLKIKNITTNKNFTLIALNKGEKKEKKTECTASVTVRKKRIKDLMI